MPNSSYALYTESNWNPCQHGGMKRADTARRDRFGRFQPTIGELGEAKNHGIAGGQKRARFGKRDAKGRFTAKQ